MQRKVEKNYFEGQPIDVGIDYHLKSWKITIMGDQYKHETFSQNPDPVQLSRF